MITATSLTKRYGRQLALDDVSIEIPEGDAVALWGHNGAGKTTVVRAILGLIHYEGVVTVGGHDAADDGVAARRLIGHVPQELSFHDELTVAETMEFSCALKGVGAARAHDVLGQVGLDRELGKRVGALSGGMKQRLAIGLALLSNPPVLLLDEPTSNLDAATREQMVHVLQGLKAENRTLVLTSHNLGEVGLLADRVITLEHGKVVLECSPGELDAKLGISAWLHVTLDPTRIDDAVAAVVGIGMTARSNGTGILVETLAKDKGRALTAITEAGITVRDFEVWR